jgi:ABC-type cobalamin/Fe3+-siderophores transport system ATPase subunit
MDNNEFKYLEKIYIERLWNRFDINWTLNEDVNILVGENGMGKSTIFKAIVDLFNSIDNLSKGLVPLSIDKIKSLNIKYKDKEQSVVFDFDNGQFGSTVVISKDGKQKIKYEPALVLDDDSKATCEDFCTKYKPEYLNTFDVPQESKKTNGKDAIITDLDAVIDRLEKDFMAYRFEKLTISGEHKEALKTGNIFFSTINRLFKPTGKQLNSKAAKLSFILEDNKPIHWSELSSGEKQLLIILLTVLCQDEKPSVLLMDEPEISLHLRWQYELIDIIRALNPKCQLIIVTHSPGMYGNGWGDKVTYINHIKKDMSALTNDFDNWKNPQKVEKV